MARKMTLAEMASGGRKYFQYLARGGLFNINLEVTKQCNARCDFCDYWKEKPAPELPDYVEVVRKLDPLSVSLTGGEPLLRQDLEQVIGSLRHGFEFLFISLITNGALLTVERGRKLWDAGLDELSISLDYLDERHDQGRRLPGLTRHILDVAPRLLASGIVLCFNVVLKRGNYREIPRLVRAAADLGVKVSVSTYNGRRVGNRSHVIEKEELRGVREVIEELKQLKRQLGNLSTGEYYLDRIPDFFARGGVPGCTAGLNWIQVTPDGMIKRCSDHPVAAHFSRWHKGFFAPTGCDLCWYSCRGAAQEPWSLKRFAEMTVDALGLQETSR